MMPCAKMHPKISTELDWTDEMGSDHWHHDEAFLLSSLTGLMLSCVSSGASRTAEMREPNRKDKGT